MLKNASRYITKHYITMFLLPCYLIFIKHFHWNVNESSVELDRPKLAHLNALVLFFSAELTGIDRI